MRIGRRHRFRDQSPSSIPPIGVGRPARAPTRSAVNTTRIVRAAIQKMSVTGRRGFAVKSCRCRTWLACFLQGGSAHEDCEQSSVP